MGIAKHGDVVVYSQSFSGSISKELKHIFVTSTPNLMPLRLRN